MGILFAMMGMNSWFFGRIDYEVRVCLSACLYVCLSVCLYLCSSEASSLFFSLEFLTLRLGFLVHPLFLLQLGYPLPMFIACP
jgi:hypothetical protein